MEQAQPLPDGGLVGRTLGHYRVVERLGKGGMGEVYVAQDLALERRVALKILPPELAADPGRRARFERESKAIAALNHPNIVTIHGVGEADGVSYIAMELVEGRTLSAWIPEHGFPLAQLFELAIPLVEAVAAAHEQGITHRDLKPDNVIVGSDRRLKVLDFGLARRERELGLGDATLGTRTASLTQEGLIVGTVSYMSPEQSEGKPVDARSDIFSLGVMFYEMATGRRPFQGDTSISIISSILKDNPSPVTELNATLPEHLGRIVRRCLHKDPARRYQTALDLRSELDELRREIDAPGASGIRRRVSAATPVWRRPAVLGAIVATAAVVLLVADQVRRRSATAVPASEAAAGATAPALAAAEAHATLGEFPEALRLYRELAASDDRALAATATARIAALEQRIRPEYDRLVAEGRNRLERRELTRAVESLRRATSLLPGDSAGPYWLARTLAAQGKRSEALDALDLAVRGGGATRSWFEERGFEPLRREPRFRELVATALGEDVARQLTAAPAAAAKADTASASTASPGVVDSAPAARTVPAPAPASASGPRFVRGMDGTISDRDTGLVWGAAKAVTQWKDAESWCEKYRGGGLDGWRMPTQKEAQALCGARDAGLAPPRYLWTAERQDKAGAVYNCAENRFEAWWTTADGRKAKKDESGIEPQALPVRNR